MILRETLDYITTLQIVYLTLFQTLITCNLQKLIKPNRLVISITISFITFIRDIRLFQIWPSQTNVPPSNDLNLIKFSCSLKPHHLYLSALRYKVYTWAQNYNASLKLRET